MLFWLPRPVQALFMLLLMIASTAFWVIPIYISVIFKLLIPIKAWRDLCSRFASWCAQTWALFNSIYIALFMRVQWDIRLPDGLDPKGQYLVCSNHQSWNDIVVVMKAFGFKTPFFKFFLKQELIWVPLLGMAWWGLDYPFMKRYTREQVTKNPALKGKDIETTRRACEKFKTQPVLVLNFLEGTRFTPEKHKRMASPYKYLLKPKSGGLAFAMTSFGERINTLLDITIVYPDGSKGIWDFLAGRVPRVIVEVKKITLPHEFYEGDYENDPMYRARFHTWIAQLWQAKDQRIGELLAEAGVPPKS